MLDDPLELSRSLGPDDWGLSRRYFYSMVPTVLWQTVDLLLIVVAKLVLLVLVPAGGACTTNTKKRFNLGTILDPGGTCRPLATSLYSSHCS